MQCDQLFGLPPAAAIGAPQRDLQRPVAPFLLPHDAQQQILSLRLKVEPRHAG
jgi:hypothetical protein